MNTAQIVATLRAIANPGTEISAAEIDEIRKPLVSYLSIDNPEEIALDPEEVEAIAAEVPCVPYVPSVPEM